MFSHPGGGLSDIVRRCGCRSAPAPIAGSWAQVTTVRTHAGALRKRAIDGFVRLRMQLYTE
jgi:hypothetical protein